MFDYNGPLNSTAGRMLNRRAKKNIEVANEIKNYLKYFENTLNNIANRKVRWMHLHMNNNWAKGAVCKVTGMVCTFKHATKKKIKFSFK